MAKDIFETASIPQAVAKMVVPSIMSMLVLILYNIADIFFVGKTGDANQVAAVSLTIPVFMLFIAVGNIFGIGGSSVISRSIGRGDKARAARISSFCFYASIVSGLIMIALFLLGMGVISRIIGTNEKTVDFARSYLTYIAVGAPFIIIPAAFGHIVRGEGAPKQAMIGMMIGTIINIILDPIMILAMDMGVAGAALATVIGNVVGSIYFIHYLVGKKTLLSIRLRDAKIDRDDASGVFGIGIPASLNSVLMSTAFILLNNVLNGYADGEIYIAAMGVAKRAGIFLIFTQLGFAMGIQPLVGYCYGARNMERLKKIIRFSFICTAVLGIISTIVYALAADVIIKAFIADEAVVENGVKIMHALIISYPVIGVLFVITFSFQAMGMVGSSLLLNVSRQGLVFIPLLYIFNATVGLGGVYYSQAIADYVSVFIAITLFVLAMKKAAR
ncbi:MAG: MATE family efflux transporter [Actinomycetota bacterium]|nr:MATE family efflux transporter [Actinomycetota bacterium]MDD5665709.1 MATE family efflux transporter [Actinomycetota bacterium]